MNNADVSNAERRLHEIEQRLERFEAPEPPASLLASIQAEIPAQPDEGAGQGGSGAYRLPWRRLAASLAVVALGGLLGYRLLRDGPTAEEVAAGSLAAGSDEPRAVVVELGEPMDSSSAQVESSPVGGNLPDSVTSGAPARLEGDRDAVARQDAALPEIESLTAGPGEGPGPTVGVRRQPAQAAPVAPHEFEAKVELGEGGSGSLSPAAVDRVNVGGNETGEKVDLRDSAAAKRVVENQEIGELSARAEELEKQLDSAAVSESLLVVSESPMLKDVPKPEPTMMASPQLPPATPSVMADEAPPVGIARRRTEVRERLRALGNVIGAPSTGGTAEPNDQAYGDMFFQAYGTNPFIDTEDDAQSTFGIDVDTASYTMARSYLERGSLPPADAIRVEEFVNYFDYNDPAPRTRDFAVVAEGAPSPFASTARTHLLRFALKGREIAESQRKAAVLTFVVDVSGSMNRENRLGLVKRALRLLVGELDSGDAIGLVVYGSSGRVILEPTSNHHHVLSAIESLQPGGSTNAEEGLVLGYRIARRFFRDGAINRVILCSDGVANVGNTGPESILNRIASEAEQGVELTTVGFGMGNYNDVLMEQLADKGDGNYAYVDDLDAARRVFVENLSGTLETIAGDAKIQVEFDKQMVQSYRLLGYENRDIADRDFRNDAVDAGEIGAGHQVTALYEVKLRPHAARRGDVATLRLRYESRRSGRVVEDAVTLRRSDLAANWERASHGLQVAATAAEFAETLRGSYWARDSNLTALAERARGLARSGSRAGDLAELSELIERAARLRGAPVGQWEDGIER